MLRAEIQRALRRAPRQLRGLRLGLQTRRSSNHSAAHVGESNSRSNVFQISRTSVCVSSRCLHSLLLEMGNQCRNTTRVAHFISSTLSACANPLADPAVEKFCRASSAGGRLNLRSNIEQSDRVGRRGLSEPGGIFSRLITYAFPRLFSGAAVLHGASTK